jgi:hypothetical protein
MADRRMRQALKPPPLTYLAARFNNPLGCKTNDTEEPIIDSDPEPNHVKVWRRALNAAETALQKEIVQSYLNV